MRVGVNMIERIYIKYKDSGIVRMLLCSPNIGASYTDKDARNISILVGKLNSMSTNDYYEVIYG